MELIKTVSIEKMASVKYIIFIRTITKSRKMQTNKN